MVEAASLHVIGTTVEIGLSLGRSGQEFFVHNFYYKKRNKRMKETPSQTSSSCSHGEHK